PGGHAAADRGCRCGGRPPSVTVRSPHAPGPPGTTEDTYADERPSAVVHDRAHDPAASRRTSLRKVVNPLSELMRAIRPEGACSTRPSMRRGGCARASRWSTNVRSGGKLEGHRTRGLIRQRSVSFALP